MFSETFFELQKMFRKLRNDKIYRKFQNLKGYSWDKLSEISKMQFKSTDKI